MKLHLIFILCVVKTSLTKSSRTTNSKLEGNALIDRILNADRFHELADKIVAKALEKLKLDKSDKSYEPIKNTTQLQSDKDKTSLRVNKKAHKSKVAKIDMGAVLQKKIIPLNDLIFRYERFTKNPNSTSKKPHSKINDTDKKKRQKSGKGNADKKSGKKGSKHKSRLSSNEQSEKSKEDSNKGKQTDLSSENMTYNTKVQNMSLESKFGDDKVIDWSVDDEKEDTIDLDKSVDEKHTGKNKVSKPKLTTEIVLRAQDTASNEEYDNKEKNNGDQSDEALISAKDKQADNDSLKLPDADLPVNRTESYDKNETSIVLRANEKDLTSNDEEETDLKQAVDQTVMKSDDETDTLAITEDGSSVVLSEHKKKNKRIVRKEGDKWFAFEESPDYAEYHEKLSELRKTQRKSVF